MILKWKEYVHVVILLAFKTVSESNLRNFVHLLSGYFQNSLHVVAASFALFTQ